MRILRPIFATTLLLVFLLPAVNTRASNPPTVGGCQVFPTGNPWNADISGAAIDHSMDTFLTNVGGSHVHPDFGSDPTYGIPYVTVTSAQPKVPVTFDYDDESDPGPYPFPTNAPVEGGAGAGGDRHVLVVDTTNCILYETWDSHYVGGAKHAWHAGSGAIFDLNSNALRPDGWTSADAAGLPILPGLARCDEAMSGTINHAFRVTFSSTQDAHIYPATHDAGDNNVNLPKMGQRFRLKAGFNISTFTPQAKAIAQALKTYGLITADNGSNWYISGEADRNNCWDDDDLNDLKTIPGNQFEAVVSPAPATVMLPAPSLYSPADGAQVSGIPVLDWNTVTSADTYKVYLDQNPNPTTLVATTQADEITEITPNVPLLTGFTYYWKVQATDNGTSTTTTSTAQSFIMASPAGAAPTPNYYTTGFPTFTWNRVIGAVSYHVQVSGNSAFTGTPLKDTSINAPTLFYTYAAASGLSDGTYYWRVQACSAPSTCGTWVAQTFVVNS